MMKRSGSAVWNEYKRNKTNGRYDPKKAAHKAYVRRRDSKYQGMKVATNLELYGKVEAWLLDGQSPEGISKRIKRQERGLPDVSKNSIRRFIKSPYGREIEYHINKRKKPRRRRGRKAVWGDKKSIHDRPISIEKRRHVGDAEGDFIASGKTGKGVLLHIVDRKLRCKFLERIIHPTKTNIKRAGLRIKKRYPEWKSMTTDNDILLRCQKELEAAWSIDIYFCDEHSPWQKGAVENANGEVRQYIPKSSNISKYSRNFIKKLEARLNRKFMDCLDSLSPAEALERYRKRKTARKRAALKRKFESF